MARNKKQLAIVGEGMSVIDYVVFAILAIGCFLCFQQTDIFHTGASANAYLNGHILDFYDYNATFLGGNSYYPSTYIAFAIWNIPLKIIGQAYESMAVPFGVILWYKLMPCLLYLYSAYILFKIAKEMGMGSNKSKMCAYGFLTTPIAFFSQFIFGQYDILTVFFMLLGLLYYVRKDMKRFVTFFAIAITFKYFALLFFVPLLLLREKKYLKILLCMIGVALPIALETAVYYSSAAFRVGVLEFSATNYVTVVGFEIFNATSLSLVVLFFIAVCAWAYFTEPESDLRENQWAMFFLNGVIFISFGLSMWHPQWLLMAMPFLVLSTFAHKKPDVFLLLDIAMMLAYTMFVSGTWPNHVDQNLMRYGLFGDLCINIGYVFPMRRIFHITYAPMLYSALSAAFLANAVFKHPKFMLEDFSQSVKKHWNLVRVRFVLGIAIFVVPALISFFAMFILPNPFLLIPYEPSYEISAGQMVKGYQVSQDFVSEKDNIEKIEVYLKVLGNSIDSHMDVAITDVATGEEILRHTIYTSATFDNSYVQFEIPKTPLVIGNQYRITFESPDANEFNSITLFGSTNEPVTPERFASVNGVPRDYNLCVTLYAK